MAIQKAHIKIMKIFSIAYLFFLLTATTLHAGEPQHLKVKANPGDGVYSLLNRYNLNQSKCNLDYLRSINNLSDNLKLIIGKSYNLPILVYQYNGKSIRSTTGNNDWDLAKKIQAYNENMHKAGLKSKDYRSDNILWVPYEYLHCGGESHKTNAAAQITCPIFGKKHEKVTIKSTKLTGQVYYIVAGHGGPDPGAIGKYNGKMLCEDEYAYDISLRLARNLLEHSATVYIIIRDKNDGIRDEAILKPDKDEVCWKNREIPLNQVKRLNQRVDAINRLYKEHKQKGAKKQRAIILHVDSRSSRHRVDMFFYHSPKSKTGKKLSITLKNTIEKKYNRHQKSRGYSGTVKARNLHVLRKTHPVAVFIELGNIRNSKDQKRFIIKDNRQAVANWLTDGLLVE